MGCSSRWWVAYERVMNGWAFSMGYGILTVGARLRRSGLRLVERRAAIRQQLAKHGAMATRLVLAVAAEREVGPKRERGEKVQRAAGRPFGHLGFEGADEGIPFRGRAGGLALRHQPGAGRQVRIPDVEPVVGGVAFLADAARRTAHGADPGPLMRIAGCAQANDPKRHDALFAGRRANGPSFVSTEAGPTWAKG